MPKTTDQRRARELSARTARDVRALRTAWDNYQARLEDLSNVLPCPSVWPGDPAGPGYLGTRCDLLEGHVARNATPHRQRMPGTQVTVEW